MTRILLIVVVFVFTIVACTSSTSKNDEKLSHGEKVKIEQYLVEGQQLYTIHCANCHQPDGAGLAQLFPPLKNSDYLKENFETAICSMRYGLEGEIVVNGVTYNQKMPGISTLTDLEIAEIATYIYNSWGNERGLVAVNDVKEVLKNCKK
ncbi:cytochrome c [Fulvivirga sp. RKSG066]|uniref:c-type cytochrome n=1 Tax=Fulvivirga aurantia TaxID=2529383 RepID=UPI0012BC7C0B|nr:cytochrome c [Fulvivirga aurantia]MTI20029.1 cytochrome c [Fulvivirga aurantia]